MENKFSISLPKNSGIVEIESPQSLVLIGANGSGKTRLGAWIETESDLKDKVHRISAQKSLVMPNSVMPKSIDLAKKDLLVGKEDVEQTTFHFWKNTNRWGGKPAIFPLNDFNKLMVYLFSDSTEKSAKYLNESIEAKERVEPPVRKLDLVKRVWEKILPHRKLIINGLDIQTCPTNNIESKYNSSEMSDGERVIFYLIGQCLSAPENGVIIIDEPELHLHKSIQAPLWIEIQKLRPDCLFIFMTHDVDFAVALPDSKKIWLKAYDGSSWDWEVVEDIDGMPEDLLLEILGSRKPVVLVESEKGKLDAKLYQAILNDFLVIPCGSCMQVIQRTKSLRNSEQLHNFDVYGIIDRDRRVEPEIYSLKANGVYTLEVAEVENLFCVPEVLKIVSSRLERNPEKDLEQAKNLIMKRLNSELEHQISLHVASEIKFQLNCFDEKASGKDALKSALKSLTSTINVEHIYDEKESLFKDIIASDDYIQLLKVYNRKSLPSQISGSVGLKNNELADFVVRMANGSARDEVKQALKSYFGDFAEKM